jgi:NTE family protein
MRPDSQRALVLQGGGSLGAYEAGAYEALYERLLKWIKKKEKQVNHF